MSKKSAVLLAGLGLAATAAGAWVVRRRSIQADAIETAAVTAPGADAPVASEGRGDNEEAADLAAAADDEPVNIR